MEKRKAVMGIIEHNGTPHLKNKQHDFEHHTVLASVELLGFISYPYYFSTSFDEGLARDYSLFMFLSDFSFVLLTLFFSSIESTTRSHSFTVCTCVFYFC
jgi:hypothetical protein